MNTTHPTAATSTPEPVTDPPPPRDWPKEAIEVLTALEWSGHPLTDQARDRGPLCPCCKATRIEWHTHECKLAALLNHAHHATRPEDGRSRRGALHITARLMYFWRFNADELADAFEQERAAFERAADERAAGTRPDNLAIAEDAARTGNAGLEDLKDAIAANHLLEAVVHVETIAKLARTAANAAEAEARLIPPNPMRILETTSPAAAAADYAAEAADRLLAMVRDTPPASLDALLDRLARLFGLAPSTVGSFRDAAHAAHVADCAATRAKNGLVHVVGRALGAQVKGEARSEIEAIVDDLRQTAVAAVAFELLGGQAELDRLTRTTIVPTGDEADS